MISNILLLIVIIYLSIGATMHAIRERWETRADPKFFSKFTKEEYFNYVLSSVFLWLPDLITFMLSTRKKK